MRISDWSSDVCSSDLPSGLPRAIIARWSTQQRLTTRSRPLRGCGGFGHRTWTDCTRTGGCHGGSSMRATGIATCLIADVSDWSSWRALGKGRQEIVRDSCREIECLMLYISVVALSLNTTILFYYHS